MLFSGDGSRAFLDAFWSKVDVRGEGECWEWTGGLNNRGYGRVSGLATPIGAHRLALILAVGELRTELAACHRCDNTRCCNPAHLFSGTNEQNSVDMLAKQRQVGGAKDGYGRERYDAETIAEVRAAYRRSVTLLVRLTKAERVALNKARRLHESLSDVARRLMFATKEKENNA